MKIKLTQTVCLVLAVLFSSPAPASAQKNTQILLPEPQTTIGRPLMQVLSERQSTRTFNTRPLSRQALSNLLWAAAGINRPDSGKRTAPSARNWQEIDIYVAMAEGLYRYDAPAQALRLIHKKDIRSMTGGQAFVEKVPVNLIYADSKK